MNLAHTIEWNECVLRVGLNYARGGFWLDETKNDNRYTLHIAVAIRALTHHFHLEGFWWNTLVQFNTCFLCWMLAPMQRLVSVFCSFILVCWFHVYSNLCSNYSIFQYSYVIWRIKTSYIGTGLSNGASWISFIRKFAMWNGRNLLIAWASALLQYIS